VSKSKRAVLAVAVVGVCAAGPAPAMGATPTSAPIGAFTTKGAYKFVSAPRLHPPKLATDAPTVSKRLAPGYFMIANFKNLTESTPMIGQGGPLILDDKLQPVWFKPISTNLVATNLRVQRYRGKPALSWWQGVINSVGATLSGAVVVVDQHYRQVATLTGQDGWIISPHEVLISGSTAWVTSYKNVSMDLTPYGGPAAGALLDSAVQQYDLRSRRLISTWDAKDHIPLSESQARPAPVTGVPWDAYHVNSIQLQPGGGFVVSMRNTWAGYMVAANGQIQWRLGGKASSFTFGSGAGFEWQHDIELHPGNVVSVFDDHCCAIRGAGVFAPPTGATRGLMLKLNPTAHTATLQRQYVRGPKFNAAFLGNTQLQSDGNAVIGWGSQPYFSEYSSTGKRLFDAVLPGPNLTYRAYKSAWLGLPFFPPSGGARNKQGKSTVYASWDGATRVAGWAVLAGRDSHHLALVATKAKAGFETAIKLGQTFKRFKVQALDSAHHVIGTSKAFGVATKPKGPGFY
jgi:Arylsulfotransferase (ASST)